MVSDPPLKHTLDIGGKDLPPLLFDGIASDQLYSSPLIGFFQDTEHQRISREFQETWINAQQCLEGIEVVIGLIQILINLLNGQCLNNHCSMHS